MEERKYTFYDRYQKVKYANITAEELEVLNILIIRMPVTAIQPLYYKIIFLHLSAICFAFSRSSKIWYIGVVAIF